MKYFIAFVLGLTLLITPAWASAMTALFYQPQSRDRDLAPERWPGMFAAARAEGFDTLVVQWTTYGDAFADDAGHAWLAERIKQARSAGLSVVLGLGSDPDFFTRQEQPVAMLDGYLRRQGHDDALLARRWIDTLGPDAFVGWYLPMEIDDRRWRDDDALQTLERHLAREVIQLRQISDRPVYISSFFAGNMAPERYGEVIKELAQTGVGIWVQDGAGPGKLTPAERALYLAQVEGCPSPAAKGIVYEIFRQTGPDTAFTAEGLPAAEVTRALAQRAPCGGDSLFFELRYLPALVGTLPK